MHAHDFDPGLTTSPHISVSEDAEHADPSVLQAASAGRAETLNPGAVLSLQRLAGNSSVSSLLSEETEQPSPVREVVGSGGGSPLDSSTRGYMESRLGHDFGDVRIHTGPKADESAHAINAQAYTVGTDVVFQSGKFAPDTPAGMHTLAHELTHVAQQKAGPVAGTPANKSEVRIYNPRVPVMNVHNSCDIAGICPNAEKLVAELRSAGGTVEDVIVDSSGKRVEACVDACGTDPNGGLAFVHHPWDWLVGLHHHGEWPEEYRRHLSSR